MPDHVGTAEQLRHGQTGLATEVAQDVEREHEVVAVGGGAGEVRLERRIGAGEVQHVRLIAATTEGGGRFVGEHARAAVLRLALD